MSETERRYKYAHNRVLIEAQRILNPQFDDAVVFISGAQIELLRNASQYLNRLTTYVAEYNPGYYLTPTAEDFDSILEIVADLEETLMGNPNTIWGYFDAYGVVKESLAMPAGESNLVSASVPEGEVFRVFNIAFEMVSASCTKIQARARVDGAFVTLAEVITPVTGVIYPFQVNVTMKYLDFFFCTYYGMTLNDDAKTHCSGYKMKV